MRTVAQRSLPHPIRRLRAWRSTLLLIAESGGDNYCESTVAYYNGRPCLSTCRRPDSGRIREADFTADQWCDPCRAADALGLPAHARPNHRIGR